MKNSSKKLLKLKICDVKKDIWGILVFFLKLCNYFAIFEKE